MRIEGFFRQFPALGHPNGYRQPAAVSRLPADLPHFRFYHLPWHPVNGGGTHRLYQPFSSDPPDPFAAVNADAGFRRIGYPRTDQRPVRHVDVIPCVLINAAGG